MSRNTLPQPHYKRWVLEPGQTVAALLGECRRGIYILEFANGDRYVGQSVNFASRFTSHVHGSNHHAPWADIIAVCFWEMPDGDLAATELSEINRVSAEGFNLRNKAGNLGHSQPAPLDEVVAIEEQRHWATGAPNYERKGFAERIEAGTSRNSNTTSAVAKPALPPTASTLGSSAVDPGRVVDATPRPASATSKFDAFFAKRSHQTSKWEGAKEAILDDLSFLLTEVIPNAVETEKTFWVLTDMPSTAGGRFACLSAGVLELAFFPRRFFNLFNPAAPPEAEEYSELTVHLNFPPKSLHQSQWFAEDPADYPHLEPYESIVYPGYADAPVPWTISRLSYPLTSTDSLGLPIGSVRAFVGDDPYLLTSLRKFAISLMRQNPSGIFRRWHSDALVTEAMRFTPLARPSVSTE